MYTMLEHHNKQMKQEEKQHHVMQVQPSRKSHTDLLPTDDHEDSSDMEQQPKDPQPAGKPATRCCTLL